MFWRLLPFPLKNGNGFFVFKAALFKKAAACILLSALFVTLLNDFAYAKSHSSVNIKKKPLPVSENFLRIDKNIVRSESLFINILDLHGDLEAQKQITEIIKFYDTIKPVSKIFAEGAAGGKTKQSAFFELPKGIKQTLLDNLLASAEIGAAQYYTLSNNRDILYGIEYGGVYFENFKLIGEMLRAYNEYSVFLNSAERKAADLKKICLQKKITEVEGALNGKGNNPYAVITGFLKQDKKFNAADYKNFFASLKRKNIKIKKIRKNFEN